MQFKDEITKSNWLRILYVGIEGEQGQTLRVLLVCERNEEVEAFQLLVLDLRKRVRNEQELAILYWNLVLLVVALVKLKMFQLMKKSKFQKE